MRKYKRALLWLAAVVVLAAIGCAAAWQFYFRPWRQFRANAHQIQIAVERFAVDTEGSYPNQIEALFNKGYLKDWPPNPFGPGTMHPIPADAPAVPGCFVYVPNGPVITVTPKGEPRLDAQDRFKFSPENVITPILPSEVDTYELAFYGRSHHEPPVRSAENGTLNAGLTIADQMDNQIRWDQVALVLTAGEDWP